MKIDDFTFYFGAASGSARKALKRLSEPDVMLSYTTKNNQPWECESLFVDSGGYSLIKKGGSHEMPTDEGGYLDYLAESGADYFALQDYPCEPDILPERSDDPIHRHIGMSLEAEAHTIVAAEEAGIDADPVVVLQGWEVEDYLYCIDWFEREGLLDMTDYVGIGSVCRRHADEDIRSIVKAVRDRLGPSYKIHAFGVKRNVLQYPDVFDALDSADSLAYDWSYDKDVPGPRWHQVAHNYLEFKKGVRDTIEGAIDTPPEASTVDEFA